MAPSAGRRLAARLIPEAEAEAAAPRIGPVAGRPDHGRRGEQFRCDLRHQQSYAIIAKALEQLDRPKLQVAIDTTIAEVTLNDTMGYGVQFFLGSYNILGSGGAQTSINGVVGSNSASSSLVPSTDSPGFNLLLGSKLTPHVVLNALHQYTNVKVLSNRSLVVVDDRGARP